MSGLLSSIRVMPHQHLHCTSRTKQEPDLSSLAGAPGVRVFATRGLRVRRELDSAERAKKVPAKSKRRKKSYGRFKMHGHSKSPVGEAWTWTRPQTKSRDFGPSPSGGPKGEPNFGSFPYWRCGPILTRIGAYVNPDLKIFDVGVPFFVRFWISGFLFFCFLIFQKNQNGPKKAYHHPKKQKKNIQSHTRDFFRSTYM